MLAGQVGVADHVTIGAGAILTAKSGVPSEVPAGEVWGGTPEPPGGRDASGSGRARASSRSCCERVRALEKRVRELEERTAPDESIPPR